MRGTFLDKSKAFNKVWHEGLIFKLKTYGEDGKLLKLLENYLNRQQRVVLNGQTPWWQKYLCRSSTRFCSRATSVFNLDGLTSVCKIFADDTSLSSTSKFEWTLDNIRIEKIISTWIWAC